MSNYNIKRWDPVTGDGEDIKPMIYIEPDITFLEFIKANNFNILCEISGTDTCYDGQMIVGIVNKSSNMPNCRPNFYNKSGLYVITLETTWVDYPKFEKLGTVKFYGLKEPMNNGKNLNYENYPNSLNNIPKETLDNKKNNLKEETEEKDIIISYLMLIILVIIAILMFIK